mmetsp:Transcript_54903/g.164377  ORF Transcript_54903/g.164377 Transcript_54903/m.164377 type:complete len:290 (-) Transcript_54903:559-1428(-)
MGTASPGYAPSIRPDSAVLVPTAWRRRPSIPPPPSRSEARGPAAAAEALEREEEREAAAASSTDDDPERLLRFLAPFFLPGELKEKSNPMPTEAPPEEDVPTDTVGSNPNLRAALRSSSVTRADSSSSSSSCSAGASCFRAWTTQSSSVSTSSTSVSPPPVASALGHFSASTSSDSSSDSSSSSSSSCSERYFPRPCLLMNTSLRCVYLASLTSPSILIFFTATSSALLLCSLLAFRPPAVPAAPTNPVYLTFTSLPVPLEVNPSPRALRSLRARSRASISRARDRATV